MPRAPGSCAAELRVAVNTKMAPEMAQTVLQEGTGPYSNGEAMLNTTPGKYRIHVEAGAPITARLLTGRIYITRSLSRGN